MSSIDELTDKNNWVFREDYSHGDQTIIYEYMGGLHPPIQHAAAELEELRQSTYPGYKREKQLRIDAELERDKLIAEKDNGWYDAFAMGTKISELLADLSELRDKLEEWEDYGKAALDERCTDDQHHCGCVAVYRKELATLRATLKGIRDDNEMCPACGAFDGCNPDCKLAAALRK